ncbi:MAG: pirin family protein [Betaproteobacteria bacterium]|nr:pirin family protein [Betaproteobacteria bacterium]
MSTFVEQARESVTRGVERRLSGRETQDGAGVRLTRLITPALQQRLDPFLMLDNFRNDRAEDYLGGFPDHPHRGFETVTYMIAGRMRHRDSGGNSGLLVPGGMQWMVAAGGLIHSEMPEQEAGLMEGFQFWINLPAARKMEQPRYRDFAPEAIPELTLPGGTRVRVIAGSFGEVRGAVTRPGTEPMLLDLHLPAGACLEVPLAAAVNAFVVPYRGALQVQETLVGEHELAVFDQRGDRVVLEARQASRAILAAARPLREPIAQYGPFVMNSAEEIHAAIRDYREGRFDAAQVGRL